MRTRTCVPVALALAVGLPCSYLQSATFYIGDGSVGGGTSFATLLDFYNAKVTFHGGDQLLLQGGRTFSGSLYLDPSLYFGTTAAPITIGSYGTGRATINAGTSYGIYAYQDGGFNISNLNITGGGANTQVGITFYNDNAARQYHIHVDNVSVSGFGNSGLALGNSTYNSGGYSDVSITNSAFTNNRDGINIYGVEPFNPAAPAGSKYANTNVYVGHVTASENGGTAGINNPSGNGIVLGSTDGGVVERSNATHNGFNSTSSNGPVGIWAYDSNNITLQHNVSVNNRTNGGDGDGFDLDQNTSNSTMQYNYSAGNDGAGYLVYTAQTNNANTSNVVRYNLSVNDSRKGGLGAITIGGQVLNTSVYNNTVYLTPAAGTSPAAVLVDSYSTNSIPGNDLIANNILNIGSGASAITDGTATHSVADATVTFLNNDYYAGGGGVVIKWGTNTYGSVASWLAAVTQQERSGQTILALTLDPRFANPGGQPTVEDANQLESLLAGYYTLLSNSGLVNAGLNLTTAKGLDVGKTDLYGTSIPQFGAFDVGSNEVPEPAAVGILTVGATVLTRRRRRRGF